jgi:hypothetical protein
MQKLLILSIFFIYSASFSQIFGNDIYDSSNFSDWNTNIKDYEGAYSFGFSELESELRVIISDSLICVQLERSKWSDNPPGFISTYENFDNVKINGNKFYSDKTNGRFVIFKKNTGTSVGLIVNKPWSDWLDSNKPEFGQRFPDEDLYLHGMFPECSKKVLNIKSIENLDLEKLKIMRNEIFARYGYKFKEGGEMDKYFKTQSWYRGSYDNVDSFITQIEKNNITLIKQIEQKKNGL